MTDEAMVPLIVINKNLFENKLVVRLILTMERCIITR